MGVSQGFVDEGTANEPKEMPFFSNSSLRRVFSARKRLNSA